MHGKPARYFLFALISCALCECRAYADDRPPSDSSDHIPAAVTGKSTEPLYFSYISPGFMRKGYSITVTNIEGLKYETPTGGGQGRLSEEQLLKIREACAQFLRDPGPFYFGQPRIFDGSTTFVTVRQGQSVRASYVRNEFDPPQVWTLCDSVVEQLKSVTLQEGNKAEFDKFFGGFIGAKSPLYGRSRFPNPVSIPNDEPGAIVTWFSNNIAELPSGQRDTCLEILATLPGVSVGDELYALVQANPELPVDKRTAVIDMSIRSGSVKGFGEYRGLVKEINEILDRESVKILLTKIGQTQLTTDSGNAIWRWLGSNSTILKFDVELRRYSFSDADFKLADNTHLIAPVSMMATVSNPSKLLHYRMMGGRFGWSDDLWSLYIRLAGLVFMFARGLFTRSRSSTLAAAILLGIFINIAAQVIIAGGGPGTFVGFFFTPVLFYVAGMGGQLLRKLFRERQRKLV